MRFFFILFFGIFSIFWGCQRDAQTKKFPYPASKVWAHRVNTPLDAQQKATIFSGLEVDLIYSAHQDALLVGHDYSDTLAPLSFENWLKALSNVEKTCYWLDIKNLSQDNTKAIAHYLNLMDKQFGIKSHLFIESSAYIALKALQKDGFFVMLWSDDPAAAVNFEEWKRNMQYKIDELQPQALSGHISYFSFLTKAFPDKNIHLWHTPADYSPENIALTVQFCQHPSVKIVLVDYPQPIQYQ